MHEFFSENLLNPARARRAGAMRQFPTSQVYSNTLVQCMTNLSLESTSTKFSRQSTAVRYSCSTSSYTSSCSAVYLYIEREVRCTVLNLVLNLVDVYPGTGTRVQLYPAGRAGRLQPHAAKI
jgi:hypothetical protein